jgi:hypothetical protein
MQSSNNNPTPNNLNSIVNSISENLSNNIKESIDIDKVAEEDVIEDKVTEEGMQSNVIEDIDEEDIDEEDIDEEDIDEADIDEEDIDEEDIDEEDIDEEDIDEEDIDEAEHYDNYIPQIFFGMNNIGLGVHSTLSHDFYTSESNSHILHNLHNLHELFEIMASTMIPTNIVNIANVANVSNVSNVSNSTNNIISEINPANSGNSVLDNTTLAGITINGQTMIQAQLQPQPQPQPQPIGNYGTQEMVNEQVDKLISSSMDNLNLVTEPLLNFIENCYLENMQYDDDIINLIRYTIKSCFSRRTDFEAKELISGLIYYSFSGNNSLFSDNYDDIVLPMLHSELKRIVTQSIRLAILRRAIAGPSMEDVKLVVNPDALEKIPKSKYMELDDKIKSMNISCTVCQDEFNDEDTVRVLPCEHIYHPDCIDDWLKLHSYKCPCCRKPAAEYSAKI